MTYLQDTFKRSKDIRTNLMLWSKDNLRDYPWRNTRARNPFSILIAELLLKRTTSKAVEKIYIEFISRYPTFESLLKSEDDEIKEILKSIGYHNKRTIEIKAISKHIIDVFNGKVPSNYGDLISIPYVGPYTAGAILSQAYGKKGLMIDSNVERVIKRVFKHSLDSKNQKKGINKIMNILVPDEGHELFNLAIIDLGSLICKFKKPKCTICPIVSFCDVKNISKNK